MVDNTCKLRRRGLRYGGSVQPHYASGGHEGSSRYRASACTEGKGCRSPSRARHEKVRRGRLSMVAPPRCFVGRRKKRSGGGRTIIIVLHILLIKHHELVAQFTLLQITCISEVVDVFDLAMKYSDFAYSCKFFGCYDVENYGS